MREDAYPVVSEGQLSFQVPCQCLRVVAQLVTQRDAVKSRGGFAGNRGVPACGPAQGSRITTVTLILPF